jgi:hypothetical protein
LNPIRAAARDRRRLAKIGVFLTNFGTAKVAIYLIPILIAAFSSAEIYGGVELAQSVSLLIASLLAGAPLAGITQRLLVSGERRVDDSTALVIALGCGFALLAFAATWLAGASSDVTLIAAALGVAVLHLAMSGYLRMLSRRNLTAWFDGTATILAGIAAVTLVLLWPGAGKPELALAYACVAAVGLGLGVTALARSALPDLRARFVDATRIGMPIMIVATLAMWMGLGGRIIVGLLNQEGLPAYGVAFRVTGLALGVHQLAITAMYARLYAGRTKVADPIIAAFMVATCILTAGLVLGGQILPGYVTIAALDASAVASYREILPATGLHTFFWIAYAMLQMRVSRAGLAKTAIAPTAIVTLGGIGLIAAFAIGVSNDIVVLAWLIAAHAAIFFYKNVILLARARLPHRLVAITGTAGAIALAALGVVV